MLAIRGLVDKFGCETFSKLMTSRCCRVADVSWLSGGYCMVVVNLTSYIVHQSDAK